MLIAPELEAEKGAFVGEESTTSNTKPISQPPITNSQHPTDISLTIRLPRMARTRSQGGSDPAASGSEYNASENMEPEDADAEGEQEEPAPPSPPVLVTLRGRATRKIQYVESTDSGEEEQDLPRNGVFPQEGRGTRASRRSVKVEHNPPRYHTRGSTTHTKNLPGFIASEDDVELHSDSDRKPTRLLRERSTRSSTKSKSKPTSSKASTSGKLRRSSRHLKSDRDYEDQGSSDSGDADGSFENNVQAEEIEELALEPEPEPEPEDDNDGKPYALRQRQKINYAIPPPVEEMARPPKPPAGSRHANRGGNKKNRGLGWSASGAELGRWMGMPGDDSDSDHPTRTPRKPFGLNPFGGAVAAGGMLPSDLATAGTPSNLGKIGDASLADADPLGVNQNVTFDEVGGLDEHIHSLKEMTLLPLLYPEVFQRFNVTPPRGVLFHGPPGTGKTLLARALAASSRSGGRKISFFMRKGADILSKWVGEAERGLRLLFEEARNSQPSIIFFDEIDGLAPVRSSKQDQIHASIVSTLLALMDGMDGRGQVVVIGATNRPDAVDPALRRPGRFDREFYFGLPSLDAREKILNIMTKKWANWDSNQEGEKGEQVREKLKGLAKMTKGYGGADLRALCTEAALNAIQRRYPQVYKSSDRLLLKPETIDVGLRDFMMSIKKIVPSSARSTTSAATALPPQFEPLLTDTLEKVKNTIQRVMPIEKPLTALEEAEFEDQGGEDGALEREMLSQSMQTLRVYRPRVVIHGPVGMGQGYIGAAALHHLEGYHVQSLELGSLMGDSTRSVEAAIVQLFVEAKRHQPSVIYIPSLFGWCAAVNETSRSTVRAMLDTLLPTDPILLLAVVDGPFSSLPKDVKAWFGPSKDNRVLLDSPSPGQRAAFFAPLLKDVARKPNEFSDGVKRRKRILEVLPIAPPLEPRQPSAAELALQEENDQRTIALLKFRLGPILAEMKRKFKRFTKRATEEYGFDPDDDGIGYGAYEVVDASAGAQPVINGLPSGPIAPPLGEGTETQPVDIEQQEQQQVPVQPLEQVMLQRPPLYDMDLDRMHTELYRGNYLTPQNFLDDVGKMVHNANVRSHEDLDRLHKAQAMFTAAQVSLLEFDGGFRMECERMAGRERQRKIAAKKDKGKEVAKDAVVAAADDPANANGQTKRNTRSNGVTADLIMMTDPVKLERKLKRQRDAGDNSGGDRDTSASGEEGVIDGGERGSKRSKMVVDDEDELRLVTPQSQARHNVRFANPQILEPIPEAGGSGALPSPSPLANYHQHHQHHHPQPHLPAFHQGYPQPYQQQNHGHIPFNNSLLSPLPQPQFFPASDPMMVDGQSRGGGHSGFDPALLNPAPSMSEASSNGMSPRLENGEMIGHGSPMQPPSIFNPPMASYGHSGYPTHHQQQPQQLWPHLQPSSASSSSMPVAADDPNDPFSSPHGPPVIIRDFQEGTQLHVPQPSQVARTPSPNRLASILREQTPPEPTTQSGEPAASPAAVTPIAMVVERSPSPPLPDFHLNEDLLEGLRAKFRDSTASLSVEQLEQLRATCLGEVWRQRKEWDRDALVGALGKMVDEFLEEVKELEEWDDEEL